MEGRETLIRSRVRAPRAGAIAGILFSILLILSLVLIRSSVPDSREDLGTWLSSGGQTVRLGLQLVPFAGIAFLWFIGVLRDGWGSAKTSFLPQSSSVAVSCFSRCSSPLPRWPGES